MKRRFLGDFLKALEDAPLRCNSPYEEPSDMERIKAARQKEPGRMEVSLSQDPSSLWKML